MQLVNELCKQDAPRDSCIAVLPLGTANDLATSLGIPSDDLVKAMQIAVAGELIMMVPSTLHAFADASKAMARVGFPPEALSLMQQPCTVASRGTAQYCQQLSSSECRAWLHCHSITTASQALPTGKRNRKKIDVGFVNKKAFLNMCSGGFGTEATKKTDQGLKNVLGKASYFITGMQCIVLPVPHECPGRCCCSHAPRSLI